MEIKGENGGGGRVDKVNYALKNEKGEYENSKERKINKKKVVQGMDELVNMKKGKEGRGTHEKIRKTKDKHTYFLFSSMNDITKKMKYRIKK